MMTLLHAYHFPETDITLADIQRQLLFFAQISYLEPVENDQREVDELCTAYTPAPLGDDLQRFQHLLAELKGNEAAFYQGQLSNLALEFMENRDPKSVQDIINNLQPPANQPTPAPQSPTTREELWRARLLLKLAEILRREERELAQGLALLEERQAELFNELKGDDLEDLLDTLEITPNLKSPVRVESLIKAWGRLLLAGDQQPWLLNCFSQEAAEPFFEVNEKLSGQRPVRLLRLPLPNCDQDPENYPEKRQTWLAQLSDCRQKTAAILHDIAIHGLGSTSLADLAQMAALWAKQYEQNMWPEPPVAGSPQKTCPTSHLEIYLLHQPIMELVATLCAKKIGPESTGPYSHGLLAVLSSRSSTCKG